MNSTPSESKRVKPRRPRATLRERQRMQLLNQGFEDLRQVVPRTHLADYQKLSKIATLRLAIQYIRAMNQILQHDHWTANTTNSNSNNNNNNSSCGSLSLTPSTTISSSTISSPNTSQNYFIDETTVGISLPRDATVQPSQGQQVRNNGTFHSLGVIPLMEDGNIDQAITYVAMPSACSINSMNCPGEVHFKESDETGNAISIAFGEKTGAYYTNRCSMSYLVYSDGLSGHSARVLLPLKQEDKVDARPLEETPYWNVW